ncbi:MAG: metallophosphoesterase [Epsilonproteobacteria bacterium]|nr:metallophosphoesterase [Campylobacterota bacterium]
MKKVLLLFIALYAFASSYNEQMLNTIKSKNNNKSDFSFVVMGDNRDGDYVLKKIIHSINRDEDIKFILNNGDLVPDGYKKEFKNYLKIIKTSKKPILSIIGNHELPWYDGETNYEKTFGKTYFSFVYKNSYFIILDDSYEKSILKKQETWLVNELKKSKNYTNRFVFMHVPLYDPRKGEYKKGHSLKSYKDAKKLNKIFDKYGVNMLFTSHIHSYFRGKWHKTPYIITGGAGAPLKKHGFYHYIKVIVHGNNVKYKVIKISAKPLGFIDEAIQSTKDTLNLN